MPRGAIAPRALAVPVVLLLGGLFAGCAIMPEAAIRPLALPTTPPVTPSAEPATTPTPPPTTPAPTTKPAPRPPTTTRQPPRQWTYATSVGPVVGANDGTVWHYRVAVESGVPVGIGDFTGVVTSTLGDPRSWIGGPVKFQQVGPSSRSGSPRRTPRTPCASRPGSTSASGASRTRPAGPAPTWCSTPAGTSTGC